MPATNQMKLGDLLVRKGYVTEKQLERALAVQRGRATYRPLGEICTELSLISRGTLRHVLERYRKQILLGELLLKMGVVSAEQLGEGLLAQQDLGRKLGETLVEKGYLKRSTLVEVLGIQLGISTIRPETSRIDRTLLKGIRIPFLRRRRIIPIHRDEKKNVLTVIMDDPADTEAIAELKKLFRADIEPVILTFGTPDRLLDEILDPWFSAR